MTSQSVWQNRDTADNIPPKIHSFLIAFTVTGHMEPIFIYTYLISLCRDEFEGFGGC